MKKKNNFLIVFTVFVILLGIVVYAIMKHSSVSTKLRGSQFMHMYAATPSAILIDVRTPTEFALGHIKGAINVDFESQSFNDEVKKLDQTKIYFVYCRSGNRSGQAVAFMKSVGILSVYDLQGGIIGNADTVQLIETK